MRDIRAEPLYYVCQLLDMTERIQAQAELAANEAKLAEAQQIARMGSWEWVIDADRVTWSDELYRIYGVAPDDVPGSYGSTSTTSTPTTAPASAASSRRR